MTDAVRTQSAAVDEMAKQWPLVRALMGGTSAMRMAGKTFLPQWPNEETKAYEARLAVSTLYPAYSQTVRVLAGKPFSKPLQLAEDVPERIQEFAENIDLEGRNLHAFAGDLMVDILSAGISGVLVDFPPAQGVRTRAEELAAGLRPYWKRYPIGTVLGWKSQRVSGVVTLMQVRLLETEREDDGEFGEKTIEQVRVLEPGRWRTYRKVETNQGTEGWQLHAEGATTLQSIPFVFCYGQRTGFGTSAPPLIELAHQNVEHWQSKSDQQNILHVARVPMLAIIGADTEVEITVGASSAVKLPQGADMKFVEHTGAAIESGRNDLKDIEQRMLQTGAELLVRKEGAAVTATQIASEGEGNKCALQRMTEDLEDALDQALQFTAEWIGEAEGGHVTIHKDFGAETLGEASASLLIELQAAGIISKKRVILESQRRSILSSDVDAEDELNDVSQDGPPLGKMDDPAAGGGA
jgi:hypothetical protein